MNFCPANTDIFLARRIGNDMHVVPHVGQRVRHFPDARGRAMISREWTSRDHSYGIAILSSLLFMVVSHEADVAEAFSVIGNTGFLR